MNTQIPSPRIKSDGTELLIHSIFLTIQGEGPFTGVPAVFIRLAGCNLQCPGCDTEYTSGAKILSVEDIVDCVHIAAKRSSVSLVVITGGEPFRQNISGLVNALHNCLTKVQIETNGSMPPQGKFNRNPTVICSPKTSKLNPKMIPLISAYKYVVDHTCASHLDGLPLQALGHKATPHISRPHEAFMGTIYIQPMDMGRLIPDWKNYTEANLAWCIKSCMKYGYTLQLQLHKIINME